MTDLPPPLLRWSLLPMPALLLLMAVLHFSVAPAAFYDPPWLILIGNTLFIGLVSFTVAGIAWRNYSATGRLQVLLLGCAMLLFGAGGVLAAAVRGGPDGANDNVTIYNISALGGAILHFAAAMILVAGAAPEAGPARRKLWLTLCYGGAALFMALLAAASMQDVMPRFFVQGVGPAPLRQQVLGAADLLFAVSCLLFISAYLRNREPFLYWYAGGLALTAISLAGFFIQGSVGSPVGWAGRFAQYLGGIYFLASLVVAERGARQRGTSFDDVFAASLTAAGEKFRAAFANAAVGFGITTPDGRFVDANPAYCALTGYSLAELRSLDFPNLIHPDDHAANMAQIQRMLSGEIPDFTIENRYIRKDGRQIWVRKSVSLTRAPRGEPRWIMGLIEDITQRKQAETALREREELLRQALKAADAGSWKLNLATEELMASDRAHELHGAPASAPNPREQALSRVHPDDRAEVEAALRRTVEAGEPFRLEYRAIQPDGSARWIATRAERHVEDGQPCLVGLVQDITERKRAEDAVRESAETLLHAQRCANAGVWDIDLVNNRTMWSEPFFELFGLPASVEPSYENWMASIHPDDRQRVHEATKQAIAGRGTPRIEFRILRDGEVRWLHSEGRLICDGDNRPLRITGLTWDITARKEAEARLRASEERHRTLVEATTSAVTWSAASSGLFMVPQPAWMAFTGQTAEEMLGDGWANAVHPEDRASVAQVWSNAVARGEPCFSEHRIRRHDGAWRWTSVHAAPSRDAEGCIVEWFGMNVDITERKELEAALRESEHKFKSLVENSPDVVSRFDREHRHIYTSPAVERTAGVPASEIVGKTHRELGFPPAICDQVEGELNRAFAGEALTSRFEFVHAEGSKRHFHTLLSPEFAADGSVQTVLTISRDVTELAETQEALRESEARLKAVLDGSLDPIFMKDREGRMALANPATCAAIGKPAEFCLGKTDEQFLDDPADARAIMANDRRIMLSGEPETVEEAVSTPSGTRYYVNKKVPRRDAAGNVIGLISTARDITDRRQAEEALRQSEARYRMLHESLRDAFVQVAMDGRIVEFNDIYCQMLGYSPDEVRALTYQELTPERWHDLEDGIVRNQIIPRGYSEVYEKEYRRKDGTVFPVELRAMLSRDTSGQPHLMWAIVRDITGRKKAEAALRESEDRERRRRQELETTLSVIPAGVFIAEDKTCTRITANRAGYKLLRIPEGGNVSKFAPENEKPGNFEMYSATGELLAGDQRPMKRAAATGESIEGFEYEIRFADGDHKHLLANASPLFDAAGEVRGAIGALMDITERRHQEERIKLLLSEINHRAKNMLALVQAVARQTAAASPDEFLERFSERVQALATSQDLLVSAQWRGVGLGELVRGQLAHFQDLIGSRIELKGPPLLVSAPAAQPLGMALHELATNAGKYGALSVVEGRVAIAWRLERDGAGETFTISWLEQGGPPVSPPSKNGFGSTVIGALVESSLEAKADLEFLETGLSWRLRCPAARIIEGRSNPPAAGARAEAPALNSSRPKVLVVEDDALIAMEVAHVLRKADFEVVGPARAVSQALALIDESGCDAAVLDINLSGETSEAVARRLLANGTRFVTLSGYSRAQTPPAFEGVPVLAKPVRPDLLIAEVKQCLACVSSASGKV